MNGEDERDGCACECGSAARIYRRGLTWACWQRHAAAGTLERFPKRSSGPQSSLVDDALVLRRRHGPAIRATRGRCGVAVAGWTWQRIADELGVGIRTLEKARERAGWPDVDPVSGAIRTSSVRSPRDRALRCR